MISSNILVLVHFMFPGSMHRSRDVCSQGEKSTCNPRRFRDGSGEGDEERYGEKYVTSEAMEVTQLFSFYSRGVFGRTHCIQLST